MHGRRCLLESGTMSLMSSLKVLYPPTRASSPKAGPSWTRFVLSHAAPLLCEQFVAGTSRQTRQRPSPITVADMSDMHDPTKTGGMHADQPPKLLTRCSIPRPPFFS